MSEYYSWLAERDAPDVDIEPLASMVAWTIERTISMYALDHPEHDDAALARSMARGLWLMMYGDAPSR